LEIPPPQGSRPPAGEIELPSQPQPRMEEGEAMGPPATSAPARQPEFLPLPAREELNPDGTVIRKEPAGPLARLRRRLGR
jgi:hypothetical protein